ncbi:MAG: hypothetical protein KBA30_00040 [Clostridia bacterium]|nr:hypothetical protein [Clostridia bacterium]
MIRSIAIRLIPVLAAAAAILTAGSAVRAESFSGAGSIDSSTVTVRGAATPLVFSVMHPTSASWGIDADLEVPFVSPVLSIRNNSTCPIDVSLTGFVRNPSSTLPFTDVMPDAFPDWSAINREQTLTQLALGIRVHPEESDWLSGYAAATRWAAETGSFLFGTLPGGGTGKFDLEARHGLAFDAEYTAQHDLTFLFTLD